LVLEAGSYPTSITELSVWQKKNNATNEEARRRLVQFVVLASIGSSRDSVSRLALKGGNALRFVYGNMRSTLDLDFTAESGFPDNDEEIKTLLNSALKPAVRQFEIKARCQSVHRNPRRPDQTRPTYIIKICFQFPTDRYYKNFDERPLFPEVVELEISLNDVLCETIETSLSPTTQPVRVCSLEDILAEKLRALLQQLIRNRSRPQDVYDIASRWRASRTSIDLGKVSEFLLRKSVARDITPRKSSYNDSVRERASVNYDEEIKAQATVFIPFEEAWAEVIDVVRQLSIPD
jgi:predicted nucleotidyltransferase component of viral defense system